LVTAVDLGALADCTGFLGGLLRCVRGFAAFKAVFVFLPLVGGKTAFLLWAASAYKSISSKLSSKIN
jgi:hypothetical protein